MGKTLKEDDQTAKCLFAPGKSEIDLAADARVFNF